MVKYKKKKVENTIFKINRIQKKRGQVTVFIILAICIFIVLMLLFTKKSDITAIFSKESPVNQIQKCIEDSGIQAKEIISMQGGSIDPKNYYLYDGNKVDYVCYSNEYYKNCVMQKPLLKNSVEKEIKSYVEKNVVDCTEAIKSSLQSKGYSVYMKTPPVVDVELIPGNIVINTELDLELTKGETQTYKNIKTEINSNLYEFVMVTSSIQNWEARYGDSETLNYMFYYPELKVEKKATSDGTRVYILTNRDSKDKFMFATRSVAIPSGITGN
jgi:hypothetical protein